jgi:hypothetical protein
MIKIPNRKNLFCKKKNKNDKIKKINIYIYIYIWTSNLCLKHVIIIMHQANLSTLGLIMA